MQAIVNHLVQLQELVQIRDEQKVHSGGECTPHLEELDKSIGAMAAQLPEDLRGQFERLVKKDRTAMAPVANGVCAACGMTLPISLVQAVRMLRQIHNCPNCARILYSPETGAKRVSKRQSRLAPPKVGISRFSAVELMIPKLAAKDFEGAIGELSKAMETGGFVERADMLVEPALRREAIISTVVDHGLAFPHVRGIEGGGLALALGVSRDGIKAPDGNATAKIIFFLVIPTAASAFYLKLLAGLTETFRKEEARKAIIAEKDQDGLWKQLVKQTRATIK
jgi:mannitol/fructose-specific phosphotransferase system IIA component (Ntr-type)